jgi:hypothetical protein
MASIAQKYETYRFRKLTFVYIARTATTSTGSIILTPDFDPLDPPPDTMRDALTSSQALETAVWKDVSCSLSPSAMFATNAKKFTRVVTAATGSTQVSSGSTYDCGRFFLAVQGTGTPSISLGHLWVEYEVDLWTPQLDATIAPSQGGITVYNATADMDLKQTLAGEYTSINIFGGDKLPTVDQNGLGTYVFDAGLDLPAGNWNITAEVELCAPPVDNTGPVQFLETTLELFIDGVLSNTSSNSSVGNTFKTTGIYVAGILTTAITTTATKRIVAYVKYSYNSPNGGIITQLIRSRFARMIFTQVGAIVGNTNTPSAS